MHNRTTFGSKLGIIAATVGSSVGLGNIWRFPYTLGESGGAAFLLVYLGFVLLLGIPVVIAEFIMGRKSERGPVDAFRELRGKHTAWEAVGWTTVIASFLILGFYSVVAGWTLYYFVQAITGSLQSVSTDGYKAMFDTFSSSTFAPLVSFLGFLSMTLFITLFGIKKGIEKISSILMPMLFVFLIILAIRGLMLPGSSAGLEFLFKPDFSKLDSKAILSAVGQSFFSLSIGMGALTTYASYFRKDISLPRTAFWVAGLDTLVAILAGIMIFPAVFSFGINPSEGANLVFITLPNVFQHMAGGGLWAVVFFLLLVIAALTSTISLAETAITTLRDHFGLTRKKSIAVIFALELVLGSLCVLSFGVLADVKLFGHTFFSGFDYMTNNLMLPIAGLFISLFVGWRLNRSVVADELRQGSKIQSWGINLLLLLLRFVAPTLILIIILSGLGLFSGDLF